MAIIRSQGDLLSTHALPNPGVDRARAQLNQRVQQAESTGRAQAEAEAQQKVRAAEKRAQEAEAKAAQVERDYAQRMDSALQAVAKVAVNISELEQATIRASEGELVRLATTLASKILRRHVDVEAEWVGPIVADSISGLSSSGAITLRLHPHDAQVVRDLGQQSGIPGGITVMEDPELQRGGVVVRSGGTDRHAGLPDTWARVTEDLRALAPDAISDGYETDLSAKPHESDEPNPAPGEQPAVDSQPEDDQG